MRVTADICTKNRYDLLPLTLMSVAMQSYKKIDIIITDDSDEPKDIRDIPACAAALQLFDHYGMGWKVLYGSKRGQHISHQGVQEMAQTDFIWRLDDDEYAEPDVLYKLWSRTRFGKKIGAIGGLVLIPPAGPCPPHAGNTITDLNRPNLQWFTHHGDKVIEVDHLTSTFLYRRGVAKYESGLSPAAHREETLLTHEIKRAGHQVLIDPSIRTWHFRAGHGGIRSHQDAEYWNQDEKLFQDKLREWGVGCDPHKTVVLDCGKGDEVVFKTLIPEMKEKYKNLTVACCSPDIFEGDGCTLISIAEAKQTLGNIDRLNLYRNMIDWGHKGSLEDAFRKLYL